MAVSYADKMAISFVANKRSFADRNEAGRFLAYIAEEAESLHEAAIKKCS